MIPYNWNHYRTWDYHSTNTNPILFVSVSPRDEAFLWQEINVDPKNNTTLIIAEKIARASGDYKYKVNCIDPLANENQSNTNTTVTEDLNKLFITFRKHGLCTGGFWEPYDTKYHVAQTGFLRGRDNIKQRLINSCLVERPFNNRVVKDGREKQLPTLWISSDCKQMLNSLYRWRMEKGKPSQRWSHHCTALEGLMKDVRFKPKLELFEDDMDKRRRKFKQRQQVGYFKRR